MNINHIVVDLLWQDMDLSVKRDKTLTKVLNK